MNPISILKTDSRSETLRFIIVKNRIFLLQIKIYRNKIQIIFVREHIS